MFSISRILQAVDGVVNIPNYLDVILRTGTGASVTTTTPSPLNLQSNGGLILTKQYNGANDWSLVDTVRGVASDLVPSTTAAATSQTTGVTSVSSTGYTTGTLTKRNGSGLLFVDYVMRQAPGFLQIINRTESGFVQSVPHNLGIKPGFILAKSLTLAHNWCAWHMLSDTGDNFSQSNGFSTNSSASPRYVGSDQVTTTDFSNEIYGWDGTTQHIAYNGGNVVYYVFGHDPSPTGQIQCGVYKGNGSVTGPNVNIGWPPRLLLIKHRTASGNWVVIDTARGFTNANDNVLLLNSPNTATSVNWADPTATGFQIMSTANDVNVLNSMYLYVAFR